jgi:filamentous hemagglutinin
MEHVIARHLSGKANASQFSLSEAELRSVLSSRAAVNSPVVRSVESADGIRYVREFDAGRVIGADKFNGNQATSVMTIMTDRFGNLVSTFPGLLK